MAAGVTEKLALRSLTGREKLDAVARTDLDDRCHVGQVAGQRAERLQAGLEASGGRYQQHPTGAGITDPEGVWNASGSVDRRPGASAQNAVAHVEFVFAFQNVEGLILPLVDVRRQVGSGGV